MYKITTCQVINEYDKNNIFLCIKWEKNGDNVHLTILRDGSMPLQGLTTISNLSEHAETFKITKDQYIQEIQKELAGLDDEVEFLLKNLTFSWKKKKIWKRGFIKCNEYSSQNNSEFPKFSNEILEILKYNYEYQRKFIEIKEKYDTIMQVNKEMEKMMKIMTDDKNSLENKFLSQFITILNSKKRKIRELEEENKTLKKLQNNNKVEIDIYEVSTEESDNEDLTVNRKKRGSHISINNKTSTQVSNVQNQEKVIIDDALNISSAESPAVTNDKSKNDNEMSEETMGEPRKLSIFESIARAIENDC